MSYNREVTSSDHFHRRSFNVCKNNQGNNWLLSCNSLSNWHQYPLLGGKGDNSIKACFVKSPASPLDGGWECHEAEWCTSLPCCNPFWNLTLLLILFPGSESIVLPAGNWSQCHPLTALNLHLNSPTPLLKKTTSTISCYLKFLEMSPWKETLLCRSSKLESSLA